MNFNKIIVIIILVIIGLIIFEVVRLRTINTCPKPRIEYRYIPRSFREEQEEPVPLTDIFNKMFGNPSPWMISRGIGLTDKRNTGMGGRHIKI